MKGENQMWLVQVRASLTAFEQEVHTRYGKDSYKTPDAFKDLVKKLFVKDVALSFNDLPTAELENLQVNLGHETVVVYQFEAPEKFDILMVKNALFKNIYNSKNMLFVVDKGLGKNKFILNKDNQFTTKLKVSGNRLITIFEMPKAEKKSSLPIFILSSIGLIVLGGAFYVLKKRKTRNNNV